MARKAYGKSLFRRPVAERARPLFDLINVAVNRRVRRGKLNSVNDPIAELVRYFTQSHGIKSVAGGCSSGSDGLPSCNQTFRLASFHITSQASTESLTSAQERRSNSN